MDDSSAQEQAPNRAGEPARRAWQTRRANAAARADAGGEPPPKRWARDYDACIRCGQTDKDHEGHGLCRRCFNLDRMERTGISGGGNRKKEQPPFRGPSKISAAQARNVKTGLVLAIAGADAIAARAVPQHWTAEDRLQSDETTQLVKAIYAELESWPKALAWLAAAAEQGVHVQLAYAIAMVALPRLMRRGLVPADVAGFIFLAASQPQPGAADGPTADVAAGSASQPHRHNGNGQVDASGVPDLIAPLHGGFSEQAG
jgi:ribosomal protein S14